MHGGFGLCAGNLPGVSAMHAPFPGIEGCTPKSTLECREPIASSTQPEAIMAITLNHTIVPARDKAAAARQFAELFGLAYEGRDGYFAPIKVNDGLTFLFSDEATAFESHHYAFHVSDAEFDAIFGRVQAAGL